MKISGIYEIVNLKNNKRYIGSSKEIHKRWNRHKNELNKNKHHCTYLQRAWNKYGPDNFVFNILEEFSQITPEQLLIEEKKWIEKITPEYNIGCVGGGDNISKHPNHEKICKQKSKIGKENWNNPSYREKQIKRLKGQGNPNWKGGVSTPHCLDCGKQLRYGHKRCSKCSKIGANNPFFGKTHSKKTIIKLKSINKGKKPTNSKKITINNIIYESQADAAKAFNVSIGTISNWANGKIIKRGIIIQLHQN